MPLVSCPLPYRSNRITAIRVQSLAGPKLNSQLLFPQLMMYRLNHFMLLSSLHPRLYCHRDSVEPIHPNSYLCAYSSPQRPHKLLLFYFCSLHTLSVQPPAYSLLSSSPNLSQWPLPVTHKRDTTSSLIYQPNENLPGADTVISNPPLLVSLSHPITNIIHPSPHASHCVPLNRLLRTPFLALCCRPK